MTDPPVYKLKDSNGNVVGELNQDVANSLLRISNESTSTEIQIKNGEVDYQSNDAVNLGAVITDELKTTPAGARLSKDSPQSVADSTRVEVTFENATERNASADNFADLANNGITIPNGEYSVGQITFGIRWKTATDWDFTLTQKNGSDLKDPMAFVYPSGTTLRGLTATSPLVPVSNGDTITLDIKQSSGVSKDIGQVARFTFLDVMVF